RAGGTPFASPTRRVHSSAVFESPRRRWPRWLAGLQLLSTVPTPDSRRREIAARILLTVAALAPYWRILTFSVVFITDDYFASDIFNGELPGRVLAAQAVAAGRLPVWTSQICSG